MANVRQMPTLYLRGSLANITMKNLTHTQQSHVEGLVKQISDHPDMQRHKIKVMKEFGVTIAADYSDDREIAEEEYRIAIWRGVVDLFYHRKYTFMCGACGSSTYMTKRSKPKAIDRVQTPCPNCRQVEITDAGDVLALQEKFCSGKKFITQDEFQEVSRDLPDGFKQPAYKSTIDYVAGERKYDDPQAIVDDDAQLRKFFGEFVWNYFRQQINENKREKHRQSPQKISGPADWVILQELLCLCARMEVAYNYCPKSEPKDGVHTVGLFGLSTPPEFTAEFAALRWKAWMHKVPVEVIHSGFTVAICSDAPEITAEVIKPEHVSVLDNFASASDEQDSDFTLSQISYRTVGGHRMDLDNHVETVDNNEVMLVIRGALPDGHCKDIFDILSGQGEQYLAFSAKYGDGDPKNNHIAEFLGITTRAVNTHKQSIVVHTLANNLTPS